jgi:BolA protein
MSVSPPPDDGASTGARARSDAPASMYARVEANVHAALAPEHLEITDESHMHAVPEGAESHFRLLVVSSAFEGKSPVQRHQAVYAALAEEMREHIHALGLQTMTPAEWRTDRQRNESPQCLGGGKVEG